MEVDPEKLRQLVEVQGQHGTWNFSPYMLGMYNGMELMLAVVEDREPVYKETPESYLWEIGLDSGTEPEEPVKG